MIPKELQRKLNEGRQYRDIDVSRFERRSDENGEKVVEGYASVFDQPYELYRIAFEGTTYIVREQVDSKAFEGCDMSDVIMQYNHEGRVFARTSNGTLEVAPDATGLHIRAKLGGTALGCQVYEEIDGGYTTKMSFGFTVGADKRDRTEERDEETGLRTITILRTITRVSKLYDVSAVSLPANDATSISARSFVDGVIEELKQEQLAAEKRERQKKIIRVLCAL